MNSNFSVDSNIKQAIDQFNWPTQATPLPKITNNDLNAVVKEVAESIFAANNIREEVTAKAGRNLSLAETCYTIVLDQEAKKATPQVATRIEQALQDEKIILDHAFRNLSPHFVQVPAKDLKIITLLFGVERVHQLVAGNVIAFNPKMTKLEALEKNVEQLEALRAKYQGIPNMYPNAGFLEKVDNMIAEAYAQIKQIRNEIEAEREENKLARAIELSLS